MFVRAQVETSDASLHRTGCINCGALQGDCRAVTVGSYCSEHAVQSILLRSHRPLVCHGLSPFLLKLLKKTQLAVPLSYFLEFSKTDLFKAATKQL